MLIAVDLLRDKLSVCRVAERGWFWQLLKKVAP